MGNTNSYASPRVRANPRFYVYARDGSMIHRSNPQATRIIEEHKALAAREAQIAQQTGRRPKLLSPAVQWSLLQQPAVHYGGVALYETIHPGSAIGRGSMYWTSPNSLGLPRWSDYDEDDEDDRPGGARAGGGPHGGSRHGGSQLGGSRHGGGSHGGSQFGGSRHGGGSHGGSQLGGSRHGGSHSGGSRYGGSQAGGGSHGSHLGGSRQAVPPGSRPSRYSSGGGRGRASYAGRNNPDEMWID